MSRIALEVSISRFRRQCGAHGFNDINVLYPFNLSLVRTVLVEYIGMSVLAIEASVFDQPPCHGCDEHPSEEAACEPEARRTEVHPHGDCTDKGACERVVEKDWPVVVALLMVS